MKRHPSTKKPMRRFAGAHGSAFTDTQRLDWLMSNGFTPGKWRALDPGEPPARASRNGLVWLGNGGRPEIDEAMRRMLGITPNTEIRHGGENL